MHDALEAQPYLKFLRTHRIARWLGVTVLIGIAVVGFSGGFRSATPTTTGEAKLPGTPLELDAYTVTALSAAVTANMPGQTWNTNGGKRFLNVRIRVVNNSDSGSFMGPNLASSLMLLGDGGAREIKLDDLVWADTGSRDLVMPPHLPVDLVAIWELPPSVAVPARVQIGAYKVVQGMSRITLGPEWARGPRGGFWRIPVGAQ